ncbi:hypothetical protein [Parasulfitobacter algicola]|uniref:Uncharacterized protein n=1 Tax=Parasulfitobacter algicola TaxID=2614809 RepID=A0ABX2ISW5_9RHOB|nr:hypothetical protein [Sulfitobacter algicola]NSX55091.1 hypothetical protein [Sulfitobacter algicola]
MSEPKYPTVDADDFASRFLMRSGSLMWLLGAGASASAGTRRTTLIKASKVGSTWYAAARVESIDFTPLKELLGSTV